MNTTTEPRKRKPGAGRPSLGRTANLPRIKPGHYKKLSKLAKKHGQTIAAEIEGCISAAAGSPQDQTEARSQ